MEKHTKEGIEGIPPETTHATDRKTAAKQAQVEKDRAMQHHMQEGTQGVSPETTHGTAYKTAAEQAKAEKDRAMQHHHAHGGRHTGRVARGSAQQPTLSGRRATSPDKAAP